MKHVQLGSNRGMYIVSAALLLGALLSLCALVIDMAIIQADREKLNNLANLASLAALDEYGRVTREDPAATYDQRVTAAIARANSILSAPGNHLRSPGLRTAKIGQGVGNVSIGQVFYEDPQNANTAKCQNGYPCFVENPSLRLSPEQERVTAIKVNLSGGSTLPLVRNFFSNFKGSSNFLTAEAVAASVPRCMVYALDISYSTVGETHSTALPPPGGTPPSRFVYRIDDKNCGGIDCAVLPSTGLTPAAGRERDKWHWCCSDQKGALPGHKALQTRLNREMTSPREHFGDDYLQVGNVFVDSYKRILDGAPAYDVRNYYGPEPLTSFLKSFNSGIQRVINESVAGDRIGFIVFDRDIVDRLNIKDAVPLPALLQLTNPENRGTFAYGWPPGVAPGSSTIHPNFIDRGWYPRPESSSTNLPLVLWEAIDMLRSCPSSARKSIVLATDGLTNCVNNTKEKNGKPSGEVCGVDGGSFGNSCATLMKDFGGGPPVFDLLRKEKVALTTIIAGQQVIPNFANIPRPAPATGFMGQQEAITAGYGGYGWIDPANKFAPYLPFADFSDSYGDTKDSVLEINSGDPVAFAGAANAIMITLAFGSGGVFCPLMPVDESLTAGKSKYDDNGVYLDSERVATVLPADPKVGPPAQWQRFSLTKETMAEQAKRCVEKAIGNVPYQLISPRTISQ